MKCIQIGDSDVIPSVEQAFSDSCENLNTGSLIPLQNTSYITWRFNFCYSLLRIIMKNPLCRELLLSWPTGNEYVKLYSWFITNCVFNSFLSITAIIFNCHYQSSDNNFIIAKDSKNTSPEPGCVRSCCWFTSATLKYRFALQMVTDERNKRSDLSYLYGVYFHRNPLFCSFLFRCYGSKCRQISSHSFSSPIRGACDSQACCFHSDLLMGVQCYPFFFYGIVFLEYYQRNFCPNWRFLSCDLRSTVLQDLFRRATPQKSNLCCANTTSGARYRGCRQSCSQQKISSWGLLCLYCVFDLLFATIL